MEEVTVGIAIAGMASAGKSALLNALVSQEKKEYVHLQSTGITLPGESQHTTFPFTVELRSPSSTKLVKFHDLVGYEPGSLNKLFRTNASHLDKGDTALYSKGLPIEAVIVVLDVRSIMSPGSKEVKMCAEILRVCKEDFILNSKPGLEIPTFLVLTKLDELKRIPLRPLGPGMNVEYGTAPTVRDLMSTPSHDGLLYQLKQVGIMKEDRVFVMGWIGYPKNQPETIPWCNDRDERVQVLRDLMIQSEKAADNTYQYKFKLLRTFPAGPRERPVIVVHQQPLPATITSNHDVSNRIVGLAVLGMCTALGVSVLFYKKIYAVDVRPSLALLVAEAKAAFKWAAQKWAHK